MLEYLFVSPSSPIVRITSTGALEWRFMGAYLLLKHAVHKGNGWYDLLLPEKASTIYKVTKNRMMMVGKESGRIYIGGDSTWTKLPALPHPVINVFCEEAYMECAITTEGTLYWFHRGEWLAQPSPSPLPLIFGCAFMGGVLVVNKEGGLFCVQDVSIRRFQTWSRTACKVLNSCQLPEDELVVGITAVFTKKTGKPLVTITTSSGKQWQSGEYKDGYAWIFID